MVMLLFLYMPIAVLIAFSFNESRSRSAWSGFSLTWYLQLLGDSQIRGALITTLSVALLAVFFAVIIGTSAAVGIHSLCGKRKRERAKKSALLVSTNLSISSPEIVMGISLMILFVYVIDIFKVGQMGFTTLAIAHTTMCTPYVVMSVLPRLRRADESLYEAALDLGATPAKAFLKVTLPQIKPGIVTGAMIAFTLSIDDVVISFFASGPSTNLSILVFSMARLGVNPKINALSTIMFVVVMLLLYIINKVDTKTK
jgi:spermidine/putrescine transport system permease protein